jgi:hypothetical protein
VCVLYMINLFGFCSPLWSPMPEGGEQKPKTLIIYKKHTISYDHLCLKGENKTKKTKCVSCIWLVFLVYVLLLQMIVCVLYMISLSAFCSQSYTRHTQSAMISYVWRRRTKTKKTNHIQDTHNQLWSPISEGGEQKPKTLIIYFSLFRHRWS